MDIKVIEDFKNRLVFEVEGEGNTVCNMLTKEFWKDSAVRTSGFHVDHPLVYDF